jgi:hypothetical protein
MKPLITALVYTYNHERYIEQALVSVLEQGLSAEELEIVVVDDGSTDKTPSIIQKFAPRVKHLRKDNGGQASAFNAGFAGSHGQIVAILDGDDWWAKKKLATVVDALERNPEVAAVGHGNYEFHEETKEMRVCIPPARRVVNMATPEAARAACTAWPYLLMGALTVRRKVLEWITPIPEEMVFMADTAIQAAAIFMGTLVLEEPLFYYRHHARNLYAADPKDAANLRRRYDMTELAYGAVRRRLIELGVREECVSALLSEPWVELRRARLSRFGGRRLETFQTEMQAFHASFQNPSVAYRLFKYLVVGAGTMILPPRQFYGIRQWYAKRHLGRYRDWVFRQEETDSHD